MPTNNSLPEENGYITNTVYVGPNNALQKKSALVKNGPSKDVVLAQFNDPKTGFGGTWHQFPRSDFLAWSPEV